MISSSDSESDPDDDSPLASLVAARPMPQKNATSDFFDEDNGGLDLGDLLSKAISTVDNTTNVSHNKILSRDCVHSEAELFIFDCSLVIEYLVGNNIQYSCCQGVHLFAYGTACISF